MNTHELNALADNIRNTDRIVRNTDIGETIDYCVRKHNDTIAILEEVYEFVEKNLDIFDNPSIVWNGKSRNQSYFENYQIGTENPYNCVIRDFHHERYAAEQGTRIYWVDNGIIFRLGKDNRIQYLTDCGIAKAVTCRDSIVREFNDSYDFTTFHYGIGYNCGYNIRHADKSPDFAGNYWTKCPIALDEFSVQTFKRDIEEDFDHAEKVVARLHETVRKINDSVISRQKSLNATLDAAKPKAVKYLIEITKVEG